MTTQRLAKRRGTCAICGKPYAKGDATVIYDLRRNAHASCAQPPVVDDRVIDLCYCANGVWWPLDDDDPARGVA